MTEGALQLAVTADHTESHELQAMNMLLQIVDHQHLRLSRGAKVRAVQWLLAVVEAQPDFASMDDMGGTGR